jgi:hypothetical protein
MSKPDLEHLDVELIDWKPIVGETGVWEKLLSLDEETGSHTRLLKIDPGHESSKVLVHDFWEETWTIKGYLIDLGLNKVFKEGTYSCVPPGKKHGPYRSPEGYVSLEIRYY